MDVSLKDLILHPDTFFAKITFEKKNFIVPVAFVLFSGIFGVLDFFLFATNYRFDFSNLTYAPQAVLGQMAYPFLFWAAVTLVIFAVSRAFSGGGSFIATFQNIGFGMFPPTIAAAVRLLFSVLFHANTVDMISYAILLVLLWICSIWSWYLWFCAARHTHHISWGKSAIAIAVVVLLQYGVQYWVYITGF